MRTLLRTILLAGLLLLIGVSTAPAQTFEIEADSTQLAPSNDTTDVQCLVQLSSGTFVFFNANAGGIYTWDGSSLGVHRSSQDLNGDVPDESNAFDNCDGAAAADGFVYFILRSSATNDNYVYRTEAADPSNNNFVQFNGANGLAANASTVYIAGYAFFGSPEDGIWEISSDFSGDTTRVVTNPDLSMEVIDLGEGDTLYGFSNSFGGGNFESQIFSVDLSSSSPSFNGFVDPFGSGSPFSDTGDGIVDLEVITFNNTEYIVAYNQSFDGSNGEEWGTIKTSDKSMEILFTQSDLVSDLSVSGYTGAGTEPMAVNESGQVFAASQSGFGGSNYIASGSDAPPLPVELANFDAVYNGGAVEVTWQTVSETNNAGFRVQRQTESGRWTTLGFVDSKATSGTTTEVQSYRYVVDRTLDPGTHRFRLEQVDVDGTTEPSRVVKVDVRMDQVLSLSTPAPNPTAGRTSFSFSVKEATKTTVSVYNVLGQKVATLYDGTPRAEHSREVTFDTGSLPSGVYIVRIQADGQTRTERFTVVR